MEEIQNFENFQQQMEEYLKNLSEEDVNEEFEELDE